MVATRRGSQGNLTCAGTPAMWWARNVVHPQCGPLWIRDALRVSPFIVVMKRVPGTET